MSDKNRIVKRLLFFLIIALFLFFTWKISVSQGTTPIEQVTRDGWFEGNSSPIRGIRLYMDPQSDNVASGNVDFTVKITAEDGQVVWEKDYYDMEVINREFVQLEEFPRGEGIEVGSGRYQIQTTLSEPYDYQILHKVLAYGGSYGSLYGFCAITALLFLTVILVVTMKQTGRYQLAICYFTALVLMGTLFSFIMPPLTVPDEESHFFRAYDLASDMLFQEKSDVFGRRIMRQTDMDSITYLHNAASIGRWYDTFFDPVDVSQMTANPKWVTVSMSTPSYAYLFSAIGVAFARLCRMNGHLLLLMGRMFNLIAVAAIMAFALYLIPFGKKFFCIFGLLPEVVYMMASYSYDALNLALCFLAVSYFFYMISDQKKVKIGNLAIFLGIILIMAPIKMVYLPLAGLLLLIPRKQLAVNKKILIGAGVAAVLVVFLFLLLRWEDIVVLLKGLAYNTSVDERVSIKYMIQNPKDTIYLFVNNIMQNFDYYLKSIAGEFVGRDRYEVLLDIAYLPEWIMILLGMLFAMAIYTDEKPGLELWKRAWLILLGGASCFLFLLSMYLANNTVNMQVIHGVQGRYFLPVLLLIPTVFGKFTKTEAVEELSNGEGVGSEVSSATGRTAYIVAAVGINIIAIFVQLQHIALDYYV